jgi:alkylated DNA repair dioxygenase AlkB
MTMQTKTTVSAFQQAQARYRRRPHEPDHTSDLHEMVDFRHGNAESDERIVCYGNDNRCFGLRAYPGFEFWPCALSRDVQLYLAHAAVSTYCEPPHRTNLDAAAAAAVATQTTSTTDTVVAVALSTTIAVQDEMASVTTAQCTALQKKKTIWETWKLSASMAQRQQQPSSTASPSSTVCPPRLPLSWATLGYHYDWTARAYHRHDHSPMPTALSRLALYFVTKQQTTEKPENHHHRNDHDENEVPFPRKPTFHATAAIVNYYHAKSVMGGHRDDLEEAVTQPVVSVSVGRPAVFLLGGPTLDSTMMPVIPIIVRSGDVLILGGPCRLNYHSMARLLPDHVNQGTTAASPDSRECFQVQLSDIASDDDDDEEAQSALKRWISNDDGDCAERDALLLFLSHHRININLRQVYNSEAQTND